MISSPLKWAGGKRRIVEKIKEYLPPGRRLVEPFVGGGSVFLNTSYPKYLLADINPDLINFYKCIDNMFEQLIADAKGLFTDSNNSQEYSQLRSEFNKHDQSHVRQAALFIYLNRHCYNGLTRYNKSGEFNASYGKHKNPYFPEDEIFLFYLSTHNAEFICQDFRKTIASCIAGDVIYCDPPYSVAPGKNGYTQYSPGGFTDADHADLAVALQCAVRRGCHVVVSNSIPDPYSMFNIVEIESSRSISCKAGSRGDVTEILAIGSP